MKIESVRIENFRCFKDETINFDDYTCFVGVNGAGKSTIFNALNIFFKNYNDSQTDLKKLDKSDFHHGDTTNPIKITVTFNGLNSQAQDRLKDYFRQGKLVVSVIASYSDQDNEVEVKQFGKRLGIDDFRKFFEPFSAGSPVSALKEIYDILKQSFPELSRQTTKENMKNSLREFEDQHPELCMEIDSEDNFYGFQGSSILSSFIQWVFVPAIKDISIEGAESKDTALSKLLTRTVRNSISFDDPLSNLKDSFQSSYREILDQAQPNLHEISNKLQQKLKEWAHPNLKASVKWNVDFERALRVDEPKATISLIERNFEGELSRFGHGLQRSFLFALLQILAESNSGDSPKLILAIEEPELYQHPPQAEHLLDTLIKLSENNSQVMVCTHSSTFIPRSEFDKVRIVKEVGNPPETKVKGFKYSDIVEYFNSNGITMFKTEGIVAKLYTSLTPSINELFFCRVPIIVEGVEDLAYIKTYLELNEAWAIEFRKLGCHIIYTGGKSNILLPLTVSTNLGLHPFVLFDLDVEEIEDRFEEEKKRKILEKQNMHKKDNQNLFKILRGSSEYTCDSKYLSESNFWCWKTNIGDSVEVEIPEWVRYSVRTNKEFGHQGNLKKNPLAIAKTLELAWHDNIKSESLVKLIEAILNFASNIPH